MTDRVEDPGDGRRRAGLRLIRWIDRWRLFILSISVGVAFGGAVLATGMPVFGDFAHLLPPSAPAVQQLRALESRAQVFGTVLIALESRDARARQQAADHVRRRLQTLGPDLVTTVSYDDGPVRRFGWRHRFLFAPLEELRAARDGLLQASRKANPLYVSLADEEEAQPSDRLKDLKAKLDEAKQKEASPTPLVSRDGRLQLLIVRTPYPSSDVSRNRRALAAIEAAVESARASAGETVRIGLTGDVVTASAEQRALLGGMLAAILFTVLAVTFSLVLFFRAGAAVGALFWALAVGSLAAFGFARLAVGHLNLATAFLASVVVGNGINFGIVLLARHLEERRLGEAPLDALATAMQGTWRGTLAAALTAALAYGSLGLTQFRGFRHFGVIGGVGILLCWVAAYSVLPAALALLESRHWLRPGQQPALVRWMARLFPRRPVLASMVVGAATLAATVAAASYLSGDPYEKNFKNLRSQGPAIQEAEHWFEELDRAFERGISGGLILAAPTRAEARALTRRLRAVDTGVADKDRLFARVRSLDDLLPPDQDEKLILIDEIRRRIDRGLDFLDEADRPLVAELRPPDGLVPVEDQDVPPELAWPFIEKDGTRGRLVVATVGAGFDQWNTDDLARFMDRFATLPLGSDVLVGSSLTVLHEIVQSMRRDGPIATFAAALGALLVVLLALGPNRYGAVTLVCGLSGTVLLLGCAWVLRLKVNFLDFVALPITIGIGIDYAVNLVARARQEGGGAGSLSAKLAATGGAVILCSFTTVVGYGSLLLSANQGIRSFGLAALIGETTCLVSAVVLAPALLARGPGQTASEPAPRRLDRGASELAASSDR